MKRYFVFLWDDHEALGGMRDLDSDYETIADIKLSYSKVNGVYVNSYTHNAGDNIQIWDTSENIQLIIQL